MKQALINLESQSPIIPANGVKCISWSPWHPTPPVALHVVDMSLFLPRRLQLHILPLSKTWGGISRPEAWVQALPWVFWARYLLTSSVICSSWIPTPSTQLWPNRSEDVSDWIWLELLTVKYCGEAWQEHTPPCPPSCCFYCWCYGYFLSPCAALAEVFPFTFIFYFYCRRIEMRIE